MDFNEEAVQDPAAEDQDPAAEDQEEAEDENPENNDEAPQLNVLMNMMQQMQQQHQQLLLQVQQLQPAGGGGQLPGGGGGAPGGGGGAPGGGGIGAQNAGAAALTPLTPYGARLTLNGTNRQHFQQYTDACKPFTPTFDGEMLNFSVYQDNVQRRAQHIRCMPIFDVSRNGVTESILTRYGQISTVEARNEATQRWSNDNWHRQASYIMGKCILDSVSEEFRSRILRYESDYLMLQPDGNTAPDGPLVHHTICRIVSPATLYTSQSVFETLQTMRPVDFKNDISEFNQAFTRQRRLLQATQGGDGLSNDRNAIHYLLQAYQSVPCDEFRHFIERKKDGPILHLNTFMNDAESKYNELKRDKIWDKPSDRQVIVALKTLLDKKEKDRKKDRKKDKRKKKGERTKTKRRTPKHKPDTEQRDEGWVKIPPKKGEENITKIIDGKEWNWCKFHSKWVVANGKWGKHTSETCRLNPKNKKRENKKDKNPTVQVNAADIDPADDDSSTSSSSSGDSTSSTEDISE